MAKRLSRPIPLVPIVSTSTLEIHMLRDDFNSRVVPYRLNREGYCLVVNGKPLDLIDRSLALDGYNRGIEHTVRTIASILFLYQEAWIEVVPKSGDKNDTLFVLFLVAGVKTDSSGGLTQELPPYAELTNWYPDDAAWEKPVVLDEDRMVHISLPKSYPRHTLTQIFDELSEFDFQVAPEWALQNMFGQLPEAPHFDLEEKNRIERQLVFQVSTPIGWNAREIFRYPPLLVNDYYYLLRELRFSHFTASMRERAEVCLQDVLNVAGQLCGFTASITPLQLYTPGEIGEFIKKFKSGDLSFADARRISRHEEID